VYGLKGINEIYEKVNKKVGINNWSNIDLIWFFMCKISIT